MPAAGPNTVTSTSSDRVVRVRALHGRSGRRKAGRFLIEGPLAIRSAVDRGIRIHDVYVSGDRVGDFVDLLSDAEARGARTTHVTPAVMAVMAETEHPQGILAVCDVLPPGDLDAVMTAAGPVVVLDSVADPGNVGTIIRTGDAVGAAGIILCGECADVHGGKVVRSTAGSLFHLPVLSGRGIAEVADAARAHGRTIVVASGDAHDDLFSAADSGRVDDRTCWIVGSEAHGVGAEARAAADLAVAIPMTGPLESLNAAVATAVVLYVTRHAESRVGRTAERMTD